MIPCNNILNQSYSQSNTKVKTFHNGGRDEDWNIIAVKYGRNNEKNETDKIPNTKYWEKYLVLSLTRKDKWRVIYNEEPSNREKQHGWRRLQITLKAKKLNKKKNAERI